MGEREGGMAAAIFDARDRYPIAGHMGQFAGIKAAVDSLGVTTAQFFHRHLEVHLEIARQVGAVPDVNFLEQGNSGNNHGQSLLRQDAAHVSVLNR